MLNDDVIGCRDQVAGQAQAVTGFHAHEVLHRHGFTDMEQWSVVDRVDLYAGVALAIGGNVETTGVDTLIRSEEHTSEVQSLMRISDAVFCVKNKNKRRYK